jgi:hypothetical protein
MDSEQRIAELERENLRLRQAANDGGQLSRADLKRMSYAEINQAKKDGRLRDVLENGTG